MKKEGAAMEGTIEREQRKHKRSKKPYAWAKTTNNNNNALV
jgi:hypothetical protein